MSPQARIKQQTLSELRATRRDMMSATWLIALASKPPKVRREAALRLNDVQMAILALENAKLRDIADQLKDNEQALRQGRESLARARETLTRVQTVLTAVGRLLDLVAQVAQFVATGIA